jgi:hypothetical protein
VCRGSAGEEHPEGGLLDGSALRSRPPGPKKTVPDWKNPALYAITHPRQAMYVHTANTNKEGGRGKAKKRKTHNSSDQLLLLI